ncbi:leishmanolysin-related zinc metalloendopeptidase [Primorskyibacter sp. 2E233]|uniref:leishmanolysin-related zinc metalloendopeptidase n=1 Tax=Primorskyibacter sp. 2E233 TaxID=3413431 RepID=UPI003BF1E084
MENDFRAEPGFVPETALRLHGTFDGASAVHAISVDETGQASALAEADADMQSYSAVCDQGRTAPNSQVRGHSQSVVEVDVVALTIADDGRSGTAPASETLEDIDPDPAPPPVDQPEEPDVPTDQGRPEGSVPGTPRDSPPSLPPGDDNADYGRPPGALPDPPPDTGIVDMYTSGGPAGTSYNVTIEFVGIWTAQLQAAFIEAADYLSSIILADLPDAIIGGTVIDDIKITATLEVIDGVGGILGSAGPQQLRGDGTYLPVTGAMTFDSADAENQFSLGNWETIVLHEMMHSLGFGTLWSLIGLTSGSVTGGDMRFVGVNATDTYQTEFPGIAGSDPGSLSGVPVETDGGPGTAGGHWDEFLFNEEIMTGYVDTGGYVSDMTIAALEDMGYDTVFDNPYSQTDLSGPIPADPLLDLFV